MDKLSIFISRTFDLYTVFTFILVLLFVFSGMTNILWYLSFFILLVVIPSVIDIYLVKSKRVEDWDLSVRKERMKYINIDAFLVLMLFIFALVFKAPIALIAFSLILFSIEFLYGLITLFWKISVHAQLITLLCIYISIFFYPVGLLSMLMIPVVFYARIRLEKHSLMQLVMGSILSGSIAVIILIAFGYY